MRYPRKVLFRCDGGSKIGMGHLVRCLALADQLRLRHAIPSLFALRWDRIGFQHLNDRSYPVFRCQIRNEVEYESWMVSLFQEHSVTDLVLDVRDNFPVSILHLCRNQGIQIFSIDDPSERVLLADKAFYPPVPQVKRIETREAAGEFHIGWDFILMRSSFSRKYPCSKHSIPSILVSMGGSDPQGLTRLVLEALVAVTRPIQADVILGAGFDDPCPARLIQECPHNITIQSDVEDMAELMSRMDMAIASFGMTAYELASLGIPAILICLTPDHLESASSLVEVGAAESLGLYSKINAEMITAQTERLLESPEKRDLMSEIGRRTIDGRGAARIADLISESHLGGI